MKNTAKKICLHYKTNGEQCRAFALKEQDFCYFHLRDRQRLAVIDRFQRDRVLRLNAGMPAHECHRQNKFDDKIFNECSAALLHALELPVLEDANAIQITVTNIVRLIALQQIDRPSAGLILYGLQIASGTLSRIRPEPFSDRPVATHDPEPLQILSGMVADLKRRKEVSFDDLPKPKSITPESGPDNPKVEPQLESRVESQVGSHFRSKTGTGS